VSVAAVPDPEPRRRLPSIDALLRSEPGRKASDEFGRPLVLAALRQAIDTARHDAASERRPIPSDDSLLARAISVAARTTNGLAPVINATGVVLHTGLGRAPLPAAATEAAARAAAGYSDLEVELETGARGRRSSRAELLLTALTGAEAALVVNNNAAALMLALAALAKRKEVPVSRGELIEIGGEFRLPDIMAASGAKLVEVGTTNRTRLSDYRNAITDHTGLLLKVHPSNYRVVGFAQQPSVQQLADLAHKRGLPLLHDLGSGLLRHSNGIPAEEPAVDESLAAGTDLACFSGDKLLGGPQAGIMVGRADMIDTLRAHPIARAVRVDKMQSAALESVLSEYAKGTWEQLPVWQMLREPLDSVKHRAQELARKLDGDLEGARVVPAESAVGGGSLPGYGIPSFAVRLETPDASQFAAHLRTGQPPIFCRVEEGAVVFDMRTVNPDDTQRLARAISYAMESDGRGED
jgi:L-seryl-tRNA(Ser) seleniumtransferase